jgi:hypothetical protein
MNNSLSDCNMGRVGSETDCEIPLDRVTQEEQQYVAICLSSKWYLTKIFGVKW